MSTIGGKNYKKYKKESKIQEIRQKISIVDFPGSIYGKVSQLLGGGRVLVFAQDKNIYQCVIRGRLYKKVWIIKDDYVIIAVRDFEKNKTGDILHKCSEEEVNEFELKEMFMELEHKDEPSDIKFEMNNDQQEINFDDL